MSIPRGADEPESDLFPVAKPFFVSAILICYDVACRTETKFEKMDNIRNVKQK